MQKKIFYQGTTISYRTEGTGPAVILLHGFGEDSHIWDEQLAFLKNHCQLILPDLPGTGQSSMPENTAGIRGVHTALPVDHLPVSTVSLDVYAQCIHAILQEEKISRITLLGHSMGGYITLAFAELFPQSLNGFGLIHSTAFADSEDKKTGRRRAIQLMEQYDAYAFFKNSIPGLFANRFKSAHPEKIQALAEGSKQLNTLACQQYLQAMIDRPDRTNVLKGNPLPVLFVIGTEDAAAPMTDVLQQTHLPDCAFVHVLENTGHMSMLEAPELLNEYLLAFINKVSD